MLSQLGHLWSAYGQSISVVVGSAFGYAAKVGELRLGQRRARLDAGQQALQLVATMQTTVAAYAAELDGLRARRWAIDDLVQEMHGQAIAARIMVHDLEQRAGLPATVFPPLPAFAPSQAAEPLKP